MKAMKMVAAALVVALTTFVSACGAKSPTTPTDPPVVTPPAVTVSPSTISLTSEGEPKMVSIAAQSSWSVTKDASWLAINPMSGAGAGNIEVKAQANTSATPRSATFSISGSTVTVTQEALSASLGVLSAEARDYVLNSTMSKTEIFRLVDHTAANPVRVYIGPYSKELVARATSLWEARLPVRFALVTEAAGADIVLANEVPADLSDGGCASANLTKDSPRILGGRVSVAIGLKPNCLDQGDNVVSVIAHEIGHILSFGHTAKFTDVMSPATSGLIVSPALDEASRWIYSYPVGTKVVQ